MSARRYVAIIDDDASLCRSMDRLLHQVGLHSITFLSAEDFLDDPMRDHFSCLVVDIQLGGMSGIELHQRLTQQGIRIPVIYMTAYDDPDAEAEAVNEGCTGFFRKTDAGLEIIDAIRRVTSSADPPATND